MALLHTVLAQGTCPTSRNPLKTSLCARAAAPTNRARHVQAAIRQPSACVENEADAGLVRRHGLLRAGGLAQPRLADGRHPHDGRRRAVQQPDRVGDVPATAAVGCRTACPQHGRQPGHAGHGGQANHQCGHHHRHPSAHHLGERRLRARVWLLARRSDRTIAGRIAAVRGHRCGRHRAHAARPQRGEVLPGRSAQPQQIGASVLAGNRHPAHPGSVGRAGGVHGPPIRRHGAQGGRTGSALQPVLPGQGRPHWRCGWMAAVPPQPRTVVDRPDRAHPGGGHQPKAQPARPAGLPDQGSRRNSAAGPVPAHPHPQLLGSGTAAADRQRAGDLGAGGGRM